MVDLATIASLVTITSVVAQLFTECRDFFSALKKTSSKFSDKVTMEINEFDGQVKSKIYEAAEIYLGNKLSSKNQKIKVSKSEKEKNFNVSKSEKVRNFRVRKREEEKNFKVTLEHNEKIKVFYRGHKFKWVWQEFKCFPHPTDKNSIIRSEVKSFKLTFKKKHKDLVLYSYLTHIKNAAKRLKQQNKTIKMCNSHDLRIYTWKIIQNFYYFLR